MVIWKKGRCQLEPPATPSSSEAEDSDGIDTIDEDKTDERKSMEDPDFSMA